MKLFKPLLLIIGLFVAGFAMAAVPDDLKERAPVVIEKAIDVFVSEAAAVEAPAIDVAIALESWRAYDNAVASKLKQLVEKPNIVPPDKLRVPARKTDFKLKTTKRVIRMQAVKYLHPPLRC